MCFRPAAVTLDPEAKGTTPEYRVAAFASVDLREHMEKNPHKIITADNITWEVTRDSEGLYVAKGDLSVPVEMRFKLDDNGELIKQKVVIDGKKRFDNYTHGMLGANAVATFALAKSSAEHKELAKEQLQRLWDSQPPTGKYRYYDGMVYYLSWLHVAGSFSLDFK